MSAASHDEGVSFHHLGDDSLARLATAYRRAIEDGRVGDGTTPHSFAYLLRWVTALQRVRFRLRMRYGARDVYGSPGDRGTDVYDRWYRHNEPPSYALAFSFDRARFEAGQSCVVQWVSSSSQASPPPPG